jgi:hypothetical protein
LVFGSSLELDPECYFFASLFPTTTKMSKKKKLKEALKVAIERSFKRYDETGKDLFVSEVKAKEKS